MIWNVINKLEHYWSMNYFWLIFRNWGSQSSLNWLSGIDLFSHSMTFDPISGAPKCRPVEKRILRCLPSHPDTISTNNPIPPPPAPPPPPPPASPRFAPPPPRPSLIHSFIHSIATSADSIHSRFSTCAKRRCHRRHRTSQLIGH